jgi:hypothetical protein
VMDMAEDSQDTQSATDLLKMQASANDDIEVNRFCYYYLQNADKFFRFFCFFFLGCFFLWPFLVCFFSSLSDRLSKHAKRGPTYARCRQSADDGIGMNKFLLLLTCKILIFVSIFPASFSSMFIDLCFVFSCFFRSSFVFRNLRDFSHSFFSNGNKLIIRMNIRRSVGSSTIFVCFQN